MDRILVSYLDELTKAMAYLGMKDKSIFIGQSVAYSGQRMHQTLRFVPESKRIEMPIAEDFQVGFCTGLALEGFVPVCIIPRWDFLLLAANQIVNHLDKIPIMSGFRPKIIIRVSVGSDSPLDPGPQHKQNHSDAFRRMLRTIPIIELYEPTFIREAYEKAWESDLSTIIVEFMEKYGK